ncbi:MAG: tetratricopeptide repeat protein [Candidatus Hydrogenedentes bacterium]|nr:tetratricopeptide repeat protein [Candidatus Hydrogenedentota bacterium]
MSDLWDLTQYVESHPQDYPQRWRLVKKLYMSWEYRDALEHLLVLKKEWIRKQNVLRYLAATYYRLGKYKEALRELNEAIDVWPGEVCLREQLARVLESAGHIDDAAKVWERIAADDPKHPVAAGNVSRLQAIPQDMKGRETPPPELDPRAKLQPGMVCPNCGAQNGEEFERCWQCHAPLTVLRAGGARATSPGTPRVDSWVWTMSGGLAIVAFLSVTVYFTLQQWAAIESRVDSLPASVTAYEMLARNLILTRTITAAVLLLAWPLAFRFSAKLLRVNAANSTHNVAGLLLASATCAATWLPPRFAIYSLLVAALGSFIIVAAAYRPGILRTPALWLVQGLTVIVLEAVTIVAIEGPRPILESARIASSVRQFNLAGTPGAHPVRNALLPSEYVIEWNPTGSSWLDHKIGRVAFEIVPARDTPPLVADFRNAGKTELYKDITTVPFRFSQRIAPGKTYHLVISWRDLDSKLAPLAGTVIIYSVLPPRVTVQPNQS